MTNFKTYRGACGLGAGAGACGLGAGARVLVGCCGCGLLRESDQFESTIKKQID